MRGQARTARWARDPYRLGLILALLLVTPSRVLVPTLHAQEEAKEEEEEERRLGSFTVQLEAWVAQPAGLNYEPSVVINPANVFDRQTQEVGYGTNDELRTVVEWDIPKKFGRLSLTYYSHGDDAPLSERRPGEYVFGEILTHPLFAGVNNDVLADGYDAFTSTKLRDYHLDFHRRAFETSWAIGEWFVGWRRVEHDRVSNATYYALVPGIPPLTPPLSQPNPALDPDADFAEMTSSYTGRGAQAGFRVVFPLLRDRLSLDSSVAMTVMRGQTDTTYRATNSYYVCDSPPFETLPEFPNAPNCEPGIVLSAPYDEFGMQIDINTDPALEVRAAVADYIRQEQIAFALDSGSRSQSSQVLDATIGFRFKVLRWLDIVAGFRNTHYMDVGVDMRPKVTTPQPGETDASLTTVDVETEDRSVTYEGFYGGLRIRIY